MRLKSVYNLMESENAYVAFTSDREGYQGLISLSEEAKTVFELLREDRSISELTAQYAEQTGTDRYTAATVVEGCVAVLGQKGILTGFQPSDSAEICSDRVRFLPYSRDTASYADRNTGCYYNFTGCYGYDDCWAEDT